MSSIGSNAEDLVLNADGGSSTIKLKINGTEKASISSAGAFTSTTIDATKLTGALPAISGANLTGLSSFDPDGAVVFNESSADVDFRVESNDKSHMLFVDGGTNRVGINKTGAPDVILDVQGTVSAGASTDEIMQEWSIGSDNVKANIEYTDVSTSRGMNFGTSTQHDLILKTDDTTRLTLTYNGRGLSQFTAKAWVRWRTNQTNPAIRASHNVSSLTDNGVGDTNINFTNNLADAHFAISVSGITQYSHNGMNYNVTGTSTSTYQVIYHENTVARDGEFRSIVFGN